MYKKLITTLLTAGVVSGALFFNNDTTATETDQDDPSDSINVFIREDQNLVTITNYSNSEYFLKVSAEKKRAQLVDMILNAWHDIETDPTYITVTPGGSETVTLESLFTDSDYHYRVEAEYINEDIEYLSWISNSIYYK